MSNNKSAVFAILLCFLFNISVFASAFTPCQLWVIDKWPCNFSAWAIANMESCEVQVATIEDANSMATDWLNGVRE